jgi:branched-chain amino acid transport system permease protein
MQDLVLFVLLGLGPGALIASLSLGVVLTYRGAGVINLATGAIATLGAYTYYGLHVEGALFLPPIPFAGHRIDFGAPVAGVPAMLIALGVCALTGVLLDTLVFRPLRRSAPLSKLLSTVGLLLVLQSIIVLRFGNSGVSAPPVLPSGPDDVVHVFGVDVPSAEFLLAGIVIVAALVLWAVYRWTRFGLATRAAQVNEDGAMLAGLSPNLLSLVNTVIACVLAGALGVLAAPLTQLDPTTITFAVVPALGAALLARFESFGIAVAAGLAMGVIESLVQYLQSRSWFPMTDGVPLPGVADLLFFLIIVAAMFLRGRSLPERGASMELRLPNAPAPNHATRMALLVGVVCVVAFLVFPFDFRQALINSLIGVVVCLSLVVITGFVGQSSLVQVALAGVSGFVVAQLGAHAGIGFPFAPILGILAATVAGLVVAVSALRVRGVNLAVVTLAAAVALERFGFDNVTWGGGTGGAPVSAPHLLGIDLGPHAGFPLGAGTPPSAVFGFVCVVAVVALLLLVASLRRSDLGQRMLAVRSNERAAAAAGIDVRSVKLTAFAISSAIAGAAGALYAYNFGSVDPARFGVTVALAFVAYAYVGGITTVGGAVVGGLLVSEGLVGYSSEKWLSIPVEYQLLVGGLILIVVLVTAPEGLAGTPVERHPPVMAYRWLRGLVRGGGARTTANALEASK